jgi:hypothetical protein
VNEWIEAVIAKARTYLGVPYELGGLSYDGIDCRGLVRRAFGIPCEELDPPTLRTLIGGPQPNVRAFVQWAKENGRFVGPEHAAQRGDVIFYYNIEGGGAGPDHLQHMGIVLKPISPRVKKGRAISAVIPEVTTHILDPFKSLDIYGYLVPDWAAADGPPISDPEPSVEE